MLLSWVIVYVLIKSFDNLLCFMNLLFLLFDICFIVYLGSLQVDLWDHRYLMGRWEVVVFLYAELILYSYQPIRFQKKLLN